LRVTVVTVHGELLTVGYFGKLRGGTSNPTMTSPLGNPTCRILLGEGMGVGVLQITTRDTQKHQNKRSSFWGKYAKGQRDP